MPEAEAAMRLRLYKMRSSTPATHAPYRAVGTEFLAQPTFWLDNPPASSCGQFTDATAETLHTMKTNNEDDEKTKRRRTTTTRTRTRTRKKKKKKKAKKTAKTKKTKMRTKQTKRTTNTETMKTKKTRRKQRR